MSTTPTPPKKPRAPAEIGWLADVIGPDAALRVVEEFAGTRLYIPKKPTGPLVALLTEDAMAELCRLWGGYTPKIPACKPWRVREYRSRGMAYPQIARLCGLDESTVHKYLNAARMTQQLDLFPPK